MVKSVKGPLINILLAVFSVLIVFVSAEVLYRVRLYKYIPQTTRTRPPFLLFYRSPIYEYSEEFGYSYRPNTSMDLRVLDRQGCLVGFASIPINERGNFGRIKGVYEKADLKILLFGDSFSTWPPWPEIMKGVNMEDGKTNFPDFLQDEIGKLTGKDVHIVNFARDGYGILQMFDLAKAEVPKWKPDIVIFAFLVDDLNRGRSWRTVNEIDSKMRVLTTNEPNDRPLLSNAAEVCLIEPSATDQWCRKKPSSSRQNDELIRNLEARYESYRPPAVDIFTFKNSFLFDRIVYGDAFHKIFLSRLLMPHRYHDFNQDARMKQDIESLKNEPCRIVLLCIPNTGEIKQKKRDIGKKESRLLMSLERMTGTKTIWALDYMDFPVDTSKIDNLPYDDHPSFYGMDGLARMSANALLQKGVVARGNENFTKD